MQQVTRVEFANTLRGFAALSVVISHYFIIFWTQPAVVGALINAPALPLEPQLIPKYILWLNKLSFLNWGAYGVALFFLISGFVIPFSLRKGSGLEFYISRFFRIVPTYVVGFSITVLSIGLCSLYFGSEWPFYWQEILIHYLPGIRDLLWSRNIDGIIWTLEIEMKFYLLGAFFIFWFRRYSLIVFLAPILLFIGAIYANHMLPTWIATHLLAYRLAMTYMMSSQFIIFMFIGVLFHYLYCNKITSHEAYIGGTGLLILFAIQWRFGPYSESFGVIKNYIFALFTFFFAYSFPHFFKQNSLFNFLANISYPLYVIHGVAGYTILRIMSHLGFEPWICLIIVTVSVGYFSWLIHVFIEGPTQILGKNVAFKLYEHYSLIRTRIFLPLRMRIE